MGYLNNDGLSYLWGKIKTALAAKLDKPTGTKGQYLGFTGNDTLGAVSLPNASTGARGITYLVDSYTRTDTDKAVTPRALNNVYKLVVDKQAKITASGLLKGDGGGGVTVAEAGTDYASPDDIPTKLSELLEDTTHRVVSDTEKKTWNSKPDAADIPTKLSDLTGDATHRLVSDVEKDAWNAKADAEDIPTKLSDLTGDTTHRVVSDTEKTTWNSKADKSVSKTATLTAAGWSNGLQTLAVSGITTSSNGSLRIAQSATDEEFEAWGAAKPRVTAQAAGALLVRAAGTVPTIDIPVELVIV